MDGGATWEPMQVIASDGDNTIGNPCVVVDKDTATVWLVYCKNNTQVYTIHSKDNGITWSDPHEITAQVKLDGWTWYGIGPGHGIQLHNGKLVIPSNHMDTPRGMRSSPIFLQSHIIYSDDHGSDWKIGESLYMSTGECQLAETSQGALYMTIRNSPSGEAIARKPKRRLFSQSNDDGKNWSSISEVESILDPGCHASVITLPNPDPKINQDLLLLANPASTDLRRNMTLRISYDEGKSWSVSKVLYSGRSGYSDLAATDDNIILCFYEQGTNQTCVERMVFSQFNLEWLTSAPPPFRHWGSDDGNIEARSHMLVPPHVGSIATLTKQEQEISKINRNKHVTDRTHNSNTIPWRRETEIFTQGEDKYHTYRIPSITLAPDGTILAFCEGRKNSHWDWDEIHIVMKRSTTGGITWEPMKIIASNGDDTIGNPCVVVDQDTATVWLVYCKNNTQVYTIHSKDNGITWSDPHEITDQVKLDGWTWYATGPGHGIQLHNGKLVIPCDHREDPRGMRPFDPPSLQSHTIYSDDHGTTWKMGGILDPGTDECQIAETRKGLLYMTIRNNEVEDKVRLYSYSKDNGITWSRISQAKGLTDPICEGSIVTLPNPDPQTNHDLLLLSNLASNDLRQNLTLNLSYDEGNSWNVSKVLYPGRSGYSDLAVAPDNTILCLYCQGTDYSHIERLVLAQFNIEWLISAPPSLPHWRDI